MTDYMREAIMALMGKEALEGNAEVITMSSPSICKDYVCGLCPSELFTNTKADLGTCRKQHSDSLRADYAMRVKNNQKDQEIRRVTEIHLRNMAEFVGDCNRRIKVLRRKLQEAQQKEQNSGLIEEIAALTEKSHELIDMMRGLANQNKVSEALRLCNDLDRIKAEKDVKEKKFNSLTEDGQQSNHQKLRVCEICGAYLSVADSDRRLADHFLGKLHIGYKLLRERIQSISQDFDMAIPAVALLDDESSPTSTLAPSLSGRPGLDGPRGSYDGRRPSDDRREYGDRRPYEGGWNRDGDRFGNRGGQGRDPHFGGRGGRDRSFDRRDGRDGYGGRDGGYGGRGRGGPPGRYGRR